MDKILRFIVNSNIFTALGALLAVWATTADFALVLPWYFYGFILSGTMASYSLHAYFTSANAILTSKEAWNITHKNLLLFLLIISSVASVYFTFLLHNYWAILPIIGITFLYSAPKIPLPIFAKLQKYVVAKTLYLAIGWLYVTSLLPLIISNQGLPNYHAYLVYKFAIIFVVCLLFDFKDKTQDIQNGIKSILNLLSLPLLQRFVHLCLAVATVALGHCYPMLTWWQIAINMLPIIGTILIYPISQRNKSDILYYTLVDGLMYISGLVYFIKHIATKYLL